MLSRKVKLPPKSLWENYTFAACSVKPQTRTPPNRLQAAKAYLPPNGFGGIVDFAACSVKPQTSYSPKLNEVRLPLKGRKIKIYFGRVGHFAACDVKPQSGKLPRTCLNLYNGYILLNLRYTNPLESVYMHINYNYYRSKCVMDELSQEERRADDIFYNINTLNMRSMS